MNDKCAAGTGKFLEVMADALGYSLEELAQAALAAANGVAISSMCTVFAESEVTGLVHRGEDRAAIARGLHESIAKRTLSSLKRVSASDAARVRGRRGEEPRDGGAHPREGFDGEVLVPEDAQIRRRLRRRTRWPASGRDVAILSLAERERERPLSPCPLSFCV